MALHMLDKCSATEHQPQALVFLFKEASVKQITKSTLISQFSSLELGESFEEDKPQHTWPLARKDRIGEVTFKR